MQNEHTQNDADPEVIKERERFLEEHGCTMAYIVNNEGSFWCLYHADKRQTMLKDADYNAALREAVMELIKP